MAQMIVGPDWQHYLLRPPQGALASDSFTVYYDLPSNVSFIVVDAAASGGAGGPADAGHTHGGGGGGAGQFIWQMPIFVLPKSRIYFSQLAIVGGDANRVCTLEWQNENGTWISANLKTGFPGQAATALLGGNGGESGFGMPGGVGVNATAGTFNPGILPAFLPDGAPIVGASGDGGCAFGASIANCNSVPWVMQLTPSNASPNAVYTQVYGDFQGYSFTFLGMAKGGANIFGNGGYYNITAANAFGAFQQIPATYGAGGAGADANGNFSAGAGGVAAARIWFKP